MYPNNILQQTGVWLSVSSDVSSLWQCLYLYSADESFLCLDGISYISHQHSSQINPMAPVMMKAHCQPKLAAMNGTVSGATMAPIFVPELKIPFANSISFFGYHSPIAFTAEGNFHASVIPSAALAIPKPTVEVANACAFDAMLQKRTEIA